MGIGGRSILYRATLTLALGLSIALMASPCLAQTPGAAPSNVTTDKLQQTQEALQKAREKAKTLQDKAAGLEQDIVRIRDGLVAAARVIQHQETRLAEITDRIETLNANQVRIRETFKRRRRQLGVVLSALQRMARNPPESLVAQPVPPADMVRSAILLRATLPRLEEQAKDLRDDLDALVAARREAEGRRREFDQEMTKLEGQRVVLQRLLGRKSRMRRRTVSETERATRQAMNLSKQAASLRDLVNQLDSLRAKREATARLAAERQRRESKQVAALRPSPKPPTTAPAPERSSANTPPPGYSGRPFDTRKGAVSYPAVGRVASRYGQPIAKGRTQKGLTLETAKSAQVIAPYEGQVAFSGPFRGYGELLIIQHNGGYHTLLAGMARIDVAVGQWVLIGEPVGVMGRDVTRKPALYWEIRRKGQPINPLPWVAVRKSKVSG